MACRIWNRCRGTSWWCSPESKLLASQQDTQIRTLATQLDDVSEKLAKLEHLISRNSSNSSFPSSKDGSPGGTLPPRKQRRAQPGGRKKGKQSGEAGTALSWSDTADRVDRFPEGPCPCGADLAAGRFRSSC